MNLVMCLTQFVICAALSPDCTKIPKHGQMRGIITSTLKYEYIVDFSSSAQYKDFEGDFSSVHIPKNKCQKYVAP